MSSTRVAALVMVEVVGLAVGQQQQEAVALGAARRAGRDVAQGGADPGVGARAAGRRSAGAPGASRRSSKPLTVATATACAPAAGEGQDRERVAAGLEAEGEGGERRLLDVEHAAALDPAVGRERGVDQDGDREVARPVAGVEIDARREPPPPAARSVRARTRASMSSSLPSSLGAQRPRAAAAAPRTGAGPGGCGAAPPRPAAQSSPVSGAVPARTAQWRAR